MQERTYLPEGVEDLMPERCQLKRKLERGMEALFEKRGYLPIETPLFEAWENFATLMEPTKRDGVIKFIDGSGRVMALRPDLTLPAARLVAARFPEGETVRVFYSGDVYTNTPEADQMRQIPQTGVELMGEGGPEADAGIIALAVEALLASGLDGFQIDIGQVGFFAGLMERAGFDEEEILAIRRLIEMKSVLDAGAWLAKKNLTPDVEEALVELPSLFGGAEVIDKAGAWAKNDRCRYALANLERVYGLLCQRGYEKYVKIDLGMVHTMDYYTGVIFRGMDHRLGRPLVSGGRYDHLMENYGRPMEAMGFAVDVMAVLMVRERMGKEV
ncbi:ATP phosphoribosyltransferase regulatory subunit [Gehongia tenuis]|uniref:ATP phosphoribosyltransferase regulatory subunit n=1 Tax=Gehongia tenuis TaxID=2763655 RepID=A0A926HPJ9_9FIRM|nr:ATP phosphoribosyltransferase regulatory subunit [Gehongia tenuis]MBC8530780.1 ATP phosphoribosyltransferase regulatory subunit [Gehongia tenuis]